MDLVFVPGFVSHLELSLELPNVAAVVARLTSFARVITFDKRGTGLSDRTSGLPTLAERMDDIRAVMDAAASERATIVGVSEGGPAAAMFAASYPERTNALVLWLSSLGPPIDERDEKSRAALELFDDYMGQFWGDGSSMRLLIGEGAPPDPWVQDLLGRYERNAATPTAAQAVLRRSLGVDARPVRAAVGVPTLVVAHLDDPVIPIELARDTAAAIVDAQLVEIDALGHFCWNIADYPDLDVIEEFLKGSLVTGRGPVAVPDRLLATVLYTDISRSTERAVEVGDRRWRSLLDQHDTLTRLELGRYRGREVSTTGDGFVATFDGAARAVQCALAVVRRCRALDLDVRAGLHTGECEVRGDNLAGVTMHIGARVAAFARPGEVLVSRTVRDLVSGSGMEFEPRGRHELKGVPQRWELFAAKP
jgi:class 3 adenylate cyclase